MSDFRFLNGHKFPKEGFFCLKCGESISAARDPDNPCVPVPPVAMPA